MSPQTVCIQCHMRAMAAGEKPPPPFDESPEEHLVRVHPDPVETAKERAVLLDRLQAQWVAANPPKGDSHGKG